jgi:hypothetical protein
MNANEMADMLEGLVTGWFDDLTLIEAATMLRQQQVEIEALKLRVEEVKDTNGQLVNLVQLHREEMEKMRQEILMWENADVPTEVMADIVEELERRGFITK